MPRPVEGGRGSSVSLGAMEAALIDLFDTLVWSEWRGLRGRLAEDMGVKPSAITRAYEITYEERQTGGYGSAEGDMAALARACGLEPEPAFVRGLTELVAGHLDGHVRLYEDAIPTLRGLRDRGIATAIVSNCDHFARPLLVDLGLEQEVDALVLSVEVGAEKPKPAIYRAALAALGAEPEEAVFVDDQPAYLDGAAALGIATFHIVRANEPFEGHGARGRHPVIFDLTALL
jgi:putative hydrolase of the HAD superfamily